jgi:hypothetical protein
MKTKAWLAVVCAIFGIMAGVALAQQYDGPPILKSKKPIAKPAARPAVASATLLVLCDLGCNWKLDGEPKGHVAAGTFAKVKIELGEHIVNAATEDGLDSTEVDRTVKESGQSIVRIKLQPVREARLAARQSRQEQTAIAYGETWMDPSTGLMWTRKDNGSDVTWQQATDYCWNLRSDGHSDWRLPKIDELENISQSDYRHLQMSGWPWSVSGTESTAKVWTINPRTRSRYALQISYNTNERALCVRDSRK